MRKREKTQMILKRLKEVKKKMEMMNSAAQARARNMVDVQTMLTEEMPGVCTAGLPRRVEGFLYKYKTGDVVIVCLCHGLFQSPEGFVKHAGAVNVENAMQHIVMKPAAP
ncbi:hypothetical protein BRADI_1g69940v3 [Brachypodium distachyon]|uniref:Ninja-family protein n=1 Tax=Brachypodium distachyon TaxID=15368 RepID=A0A2K2DUD0_BRADI|nr:hypothetical protein BRADI_1g69940v3 [Brachypodium distachyon]